MKSRSLPKLLRQVARWRGDWAAAPPTLRNREATQRRRRFGYLDYEEVDPDTGHTIRWTIQQLTTPRSLVAEGQAMSHCVGGYRIKESSIWSLKAWDGDRDRRILTISIDADKRMVTQVAGRFNSDPARDLDRPAEFIDNPNGRIPPEELALLRRSRKILKLWLEREGLTYSSEGG
jgi:hypothetical protein